jgi:hypothetical protein
MRGLILDYNPRLTAGGCTMRSYWNERDSIDLVERVQRVGPDAPRLWGKMNAHQMICHLGDAFRGATGPVEFQPRAFGLERPVKWLALYVPAPWPRGYPTMREINQVRGGGTPPAVFEQDRERLVALMASFTPAAVCGRRHPLWGRLSEWEWGRWGYLHTDHHLRQFGA